MTFEKKHNTMTRQTMTRRTALGGIGATALAGTLGGSLISIAPGRAADYTVNLQLGWLVSNGILGEVMADHHGYFADEGLELNVIPGGPNVDGVASVASGRANLGSISSSPSLMLARSNGIPIKCIAAGYQKHPFTYFSHKRNPVRTPRDLIGKKVATQGTAQILLKALLAKNGIKESDVEVIVMGSAMDALMTGQVDVVTGWSTNIKALEILGDNRVDLSLWDAGIQLYANPYYVTDSVYNNHNDKVIGMMKAIARGWGWVHDNPQRAVEIMVDRYPNLDLDSEKKAVNLIVNFAFNESTRKRGWGTMTKANWQNQIDTYANLGQFSGAAPRLGDIMTLDVLDATSASRPKYG